MMMWKSFNGDGALVPWIQYPTNDFVIIFYIALPKVIITDSIIIANFKLLHCTVSTLCVLHMDSLVFIARNGRHNPIKSICIYGEDT